MKEKAACGRLFCCPEKYFSEKEEKMQIGAYYIISQ
jgi:hypothetical protein